MKKDEFNTFNGFTLIELIISITLISIVILLSINLLIFGTNTHRLTLKEYSWQSDIRKATEKTNSIARYSKAVFAVPKSFVETTEVMDPEWSYFMVSQDRKRIVTMEYDEELKRHKEKVLVDELDGVEYEILFERDKNAKIDNILKYKIIVYNTDPDGKKINEKLVHESSIEAINAIQVVDKGTLSSPSIALAFRYDGQTSGKGKNQIAYITIVIDVSNSMNLNPESSPNSREPTNYEHSNARIKNVRKALVGDGTNSGTGIIQQFSNEENVFISIVPFANTANYPNPHVNMNPYSEHPIYEVYKSEAKNSLISRIKALKADGYKVGEYGQGNGGTNTGDGLRRAYYLHDGFMTTMNIDTNTQVHHYMILLIDGESTFEVKNGVWKKKTSFFRTYWEFESSTKEPIYYLLSGNIKNYTSKNSYSSKPSITYAITGDGSNYVGNSYIDKVGTLIKGFNSGNGIKSYLIGYANSLGNSLNSIGNSIGTDNNSRYKYDDSNFNLDEIFKNIANDIMADFWLAAGPQIMK